MRLEAREYVAIALIPIMVLSPLAAAVLTANKPELHNKARTDLIQPDPAKAPAGTLQTLKP